jgi:hypothetical protein
MSTVNLNANELFNFHQRLHCDTSEYWKRNFLPPSTTWLLHFFIFLYHSTAIFTKDTQTIPQFVTALDISGIFNFFHSHINIQEHNAECGWQKDFVGIKLALISLIEGYLHRQQLSPLHKSFSSSLHKFDLFQSYKQAPKQHLRAYKRILS